MRDVRGDILERCSHLGLSSSDFLVSYHASGLHLGEEKTMRFFRGSKKAVKNWHMRAIFVNLQSTRITIYELRRKHVPPWIYKRLSSLNK